VLAVVARIEAIEIAAQGLGRGLAFFVSEHGFHDALETEIIRAFVGEAHHAAQDGLALSVRRRDGRELQIARGGLDGVDDFGLRVGAVHHAGRINLRQPRLERGRLHGACLVRPSKWFPIGLRHRHHLYHRSAIGNHAVIAQTDQHAYAALAAERWKLHGAFLGRCFAEAEEGRGAVQFAYGELLDAAAAVLFVMRGVESVHHDAVGIEQREVHVALALLEAAARRLEFPAPHGLHRGGNVRVIAMPVPRGDDVRLQLRQHRRVNQ